MRWNGCDGRENLTSSTDSSTDKMLNEALSLLRSMRSAMPWDDGQRQIYLVALNSMPPSEVPAVIQHAVLTESWRPAPAELIAIGARLRGDLPSASEVETEIMALVRLRGRYGVPHPDSPHIWLQGPPEISAMSAEVVSRMGGWDSFCTEPTEGRVPTEKRIAQITEQIHGQILSRSPNVAHLAGGGARKLIAPSDHPEDRLEAVRGLQGIRDAVKAIGK